LIAFSADGFGDVAKREVSGGAAALDDWGAQALKSSRDQAIQLR
jgi:hypothetical protein